MYELMNISIKSRFGSRINCLYRYGTNDRIVMEGIIEGDGYGARFFKYSKGDIFIDVGAHCGYWSLLMAGADPTFKVYAYEPLPENYDIMVKNINNNRFNIVPYRLAVSGVSGNIANIVYTDDSTPFGRQHKFIGYMTSKDRDMKVETISLNDIFKNNGIESCRILKTDCEGCEVPMFESATEDTLSRIENVVGEFHPYGGMVYSKFYLMFEDYFEDITEELFIPQRSDSLRHFAWKRKT
jgi:FkbM family methyltransferase